MSESELRAPTAGTVVHLAVRAGDEVAVGDPVMVLESMKMELPVRAETAGTVLELLAGPGATVSRGALLARVAAVPVTTATSMPATSMPATPASAASVPDLQPRVDLEQVLERRRLVTDAARPEAVAARHARGARTARENIDDLTDPDSFVEYGGLAIAAQRSRRPVEELIRRTPADGLVTGTARINAAELPDGAARVAVLAYDATVLAGTQGQTNHRKTDRLLELAAAHRLPVVVFAEGGGGRPGDTDALGASWLDARAFHLYARLSGQVPTVAVVHGACFAGNAALAGLSDVLIATRGSTLGMAGPAMIEGGGLGRVRPEEIGPIEVQGSNGVVDVVVDDEAEAAAVARRVLLILQLGRAGARLPAGDGEGPVPGGDQRQLRDAIPPNRRQLYDVRTIIELLLDAGRSVELRRGFGAGMVTVLGTLGGRPVALLANDPAHLGGAIDVDAADKAARFLQLAGAHGAPVVVLCDTPGFMVGPEAERAAGVRHLSRMFAVGANLEVPLVAVVTRKGYGLGAQAMLGGHLQVPVATLAWPTAELGPMGLEGAVRLGFRRELEAIADPQERAERERELIAAAYADAAALNVASFAEIDDVIDPADTRARVLAALEVAGSPVAGGGPAGIGTRPRARFVDPW